MSQLEKERRVVGRKTLREEKMMTSISSLFYSGNHFVDATHSLCMAKYVNTSCVPNAVCLEHDGILYIVAIRDLEVGEEVTYDYLMSCSEDGEPIDCKCGAGVDCRGYF